MEGMWLAGEKLHGTFYEYPTQRSFFADCHYNLNMDYIHESLRGIFRVYNSHVSCLESIKQKICTYRVTGTQCYFQYLWVSPIFVIAVTDVEETKENVDRTHGVCVVCKEICVPSNQIKLMDENKYHFGGNFYCDCSSGNLEKPCQANCSEPTAESVFSPSK